MKDNDKENRKIKKEERHVLIKPSSTYVKKEKKKENR